MPDYETKVGISVDTSELDSAEKRINDLVNNKQTIKIDTSNVNAQPPVPRFTSQVVRQ